MADRVCPPWIGYFLINPLRKLLENPNKILGPFVQEGMTVLEPGCGMGYFTLPLARMVGPAGRVLAVDIQAKMLSVLERRAGKAGLMDRIELRHADGDGMGVENISCKVDFTAALYMVHEVPDQAVFYAEVWAALKPGGRLLVVEPKGHVSQEKFEKSVSVAEEIGFLKEPLPHKVGGRGALLTKPGV
ncbi:MAG: class I SAM-dependent methyltransferase [Pseudomonadota bacterium]